jgi:hypothetical protein
MPAKSTANALFPFSRPQPYPLFRGRGRSRQRTCSRRGARKDAVAAVRLLVDRDVVWEAAQEVELAFDPAEYLLVWD